MELKSTGHKDLNKDTLSGDYFVCTYMVFMLL